MPIKAIQKYKLLKKKLELSILKIVLSGRFRENDVYLMTSSPRSGSTMLGNALKIIPRSFVLFEPLHLRQVSEAKAAGFLWRTYVSPETKWGNGKLFLKKVFEGKVINDWTRREMAFCESLRANKLVVKFVRASQLLPWICNNFEIQKPILLIRHPCAVIASQLKSSSDWNNTSRPEAPEFIKNFPLFKSVLQSTETEEEYLAAQWALDQLPALTQIKSEGIIAITYEELIIHPKETLSKIFKSWNLDVDIDDAVSRLKKPSSVVHKSGISGIDGWKRQLSTDQIHKILSITTKFGLTFYGKDELPNLELLHSHALPEIICEAGGALKTKNLINL